MVVFNFLFLPIFLVFVLVIYLLNSPFALNSASSFMNVFFDEISFFMVYMTLFVIFISYMFCMSFLSTKLVATIFLMLVICLLVFTSTSMFMFYLYYEASLLPILFIIMKWGSYPERSVSSIMLLLYTAVFTFPFVYVLFVCYTKYGSMNFFILTNLSSQSSLFFSVLVFFTFAVKLPIYGLHFWLPMAHVEAPTFGSMILAGILLKLGGVGLMRFISIMNLLLLKSVFLGYFLVFLCYVTIVCCFQSDFKRLVAYSSVSHMMTIPLMLFSSTLVSFKGIIAVMFLHGVSSPLLFSLVGIIYSATATRQHILARGFICSSPMISLVFVVSFFFTLSAPPFPSFISEIFFSISIIYLWNFSFIFLFIFLFFSIVYNLLWLVSINFFTQDSSFSYSYVISYCSFMPLLFSVLFMPLLFSVLFFSVF